ncbi:alpha/beta hydrolase [Marisediminicola senii]|uniref:alpha/beta hydrolase n=1 Tax=Marisediminicola senii TaxID=2711233 RepID=UPI0013EB2E0E|nr:alpha/beta hydrolase [Marisediminicola senii]
MTGVDGAGARLTGVRLFPGFPLPASDYAELLRLLREAHPREPFVVAHSRGALHAMASHAAADGRLVLLAPSVPKRRPTTGALRTTLLVAARMPFLRGAVSRRLRSETYRRYGASAPPGPALDLRAVADRLRAAHRLAPRSVTRGLVVVIARHDPRRDAQLTWARSIDAMVVEQAGGHLFPITHPAATASTIVKALDGR